MILILRMNDVINKFEFSVVINAFSLTDSWLIKLTHWASYSAVAFIALAVDRWKKFIELNLFLKHWQWECCWKQRKLLKRWIMSLNNLLSCDFWTCIWCTSLHWRDDVFLFKRLFLLLSSLVVLINHQSISLFLDHHFSADSSYMIDSQRVSSSWDVDLAASRLMHAECQYTSLILNKTFCFIE